MKLHEQKYLGIDGGGTKTELALADAQGNIIKSLIVEGCNPMDVGIERTKQILKSAIYEICGDIPLSSVNVFAGIAGGSSGSMKAQLFGFFKELGIRIVGNDSDSLNIIAAGLGSKNGIAIIMGTGICAFAQSNGSLSRVAGWGYFFDNGGSAFNIGRDALNAYYCALDGSGAPTILTEKINAWMEEHIIPEIEKSDSGNGLDSTPMHQLLLGQLYAGGKRMISGFAPMVFEAAHEKDVVAQAIVQRNMAEAAHVIETAGEKLGDTQYPISVVIAGGLTKQGRLLEYIYQEFKNPELYQLKTLDYAPVIGAVNLARALDEEGR